MFYILKKLTANMDGLRMVMIKKRRQVFYILKKLTANLDGLRMVMIKRIGNI